MKYAYRNVSVVSLTIMVFLILFLPIRKGLSQVELGDSVLLYDYFPKGKLDWVWSGYSYDHSNITYYFENTTPDLSVAAQKQAIRDGFSLWCAVVPLTFTEVFSSSQADISFKWAIGDHGDPCTCQQNCCFDGRNGILAHAFYPQGPPYTGIVGDVHYDEDEDWTDQYRNNGYQPIDLVSVAAHEIGHSLGLGHSSNSNALMYAFYRGSHRYLDADDIAGIQFVYGVLYNGTNFVLQNETVTNKRYYKASSSITAGPNFVISSSGRVTFNAPNIILQAGFSVLSGSIFTTKYDPTTGPICSIPPGGDDNLIVELSRNNNTDIGSRNKSLGNMEHNLNEGSNAIPSEFKLFQNYPNPFNSSTIIEYALKRDINVKIVIYDLLGREIKVLLDNFENAGYYSVLWDGNDRYGSSVSSGVFLLTITAGEYSDTKRMLLIR